MPSVHGKIVTPHEIINGCVEFERGIITCVDKSDRRSADGYDFGDALILPGFIDVHIHGMGENDIFTADELISIAEMQCRFGTTGFLPTAASLSAERYLQFGRSVRAAQKSNRAAEIIGAHFEGPFINPKNKGGMDEQFLRMPDLDECRRYIDEVGDVLKLMTLSPELDGAMGLIKLLVENGVTVSMGHSRATVDELHLAIEAGARQVCHLYNAFQRAGNDPNWPWLKGPKYGLIDAMFESEQLYCEVNCDLIHVRPEHVRLAVQRLGNNRFIAVTDAMKGTGLAAGTYEMSDGRLFSTESGAARLTSNGVLVGSLLTMNRAFGNLVGHCGVDPVTATQFTSANAAQALGLSGQLGRIEPGYRACLAVLDAEYNCLATFVDGTPVYKG